MRLIDAEALEVTLHNFFDGKVIDEPAYILRDVFCHIDGAPTVEGPKYILKVKNLTAEDKKYLQEYLNKSAGCLLAAPDNYEIIPTERPQGEWIFHKDYNESCRYGCNQCGNLNNIPHNFCPNCGARMVKK